MMNYQKIKTDFYNLHMIQTDKFKTISIKVNLKRKIKKDEITKSNMLINVLFDSTAKYSNKRLLEIETEELYGLKYRGSNYQSGIYTVMSFDIVLLMEKYTEPGMIEKSLAFLSEIIFNPNIKDNGFEETSFKMAYQLMDDYISSLEENTPLYSQIRMLEDMNDKAVFAYRSSGYKDDLNNINRFNLYQYYLDILANAMVDIFVIGNFDTEKMQKTILKYLPFKSKPAFNESHFISYNSIHSTVQEYIEHKNINQSRLVMGALLKDASDFELRYVFMIYNYILGGSPDSKLFKHVREKESLCYNISSTHQPLVSLLIIQAGINKDQYRKAVNLIKQELESMKKGEFLEEDLIKAKSTYINSLYELQDNEDSIISLYSGIEYLNSDDIDTRINKIQKVSLEDVRKLANKIYLDTIYLLEGND